MSCNNDRCVPQQEIACAAAVLAAAACRYTAGRTNLTEFFKTQMAHLRKLFACIGSHPRLLCVYPISLANGLACCFLELDRFSFHARCCCCCCCCCCRRRCFCCCLLFCFGPSRSLQLAQLDVDGRRCSFFSVRKFYLACCVGGEIKKKCSRSCRHIL